MTPAPSPQLPDEICRICKDCREKHDSAIRNATLEQAIKWLKSQRTSFKKCAKLPFMDKIEKTGWECRAVLCTETIAHLETLRTQPQEQKS